MRIAILVEGYGSRGCGRKLMLILVVDLGILTYPRAWGTSVRGTACLQKVLVAALDGLSQLAL
jgi:hypothetical protein